MMKYVASISREELEDDPNAKLWALIDYLAENQEVQHDKEFQSFWLSYIYDAEVLNGGHLQYFVNRGTSNVEDTLKALHEIGAKGHAEILEKSYSQVIDMKLPKIRSLEQYSELAETNSFPQDSKYYSIRPELLDLIEQHFAKQIDSWVTVDA